MTTNRMPFWLLILFLLGSFASAEERSVRCLEVHMTKDGRPVDGPRSVTFLDRAGKQTVDIREGRFCVPEQMARESELDLTFILGKERFYFPRVPIARFDAPWDISFGGKTYARLAALPRSANAKQACTVIIRKGEPEVGMVQSPCRVPATTPLR
jgi:hypothetical protein